MGIFLIHKTTVHEPGGPGSLLKHIRDAETPDPLSHHPIDDFLDTIMVHGTEGRDNVEPVFGQATDRLQQFGPTSFSLKNPVGQHFILSSP